MLLNFEVCALESGLCGQGSHLLRWLFFTTDLKPDGLDVGR